MNETSFPVSLARLVQFTARNCYRELLKVIENVLEEDGDTTKTILFEFLLTERYRFTRLLVLLSWYSKYGGADAYCDQKIAEYQGILGVYESTADSLWHIHHKQRESVLPLLPVDGVTEILATGCYARLPSIIYRHFVNKEYLEFSNTEKSDNILEDFESDYWQGLVTRTWLKVCLSKSKDFDVFDWIDKEDQKGVQVGNKTASWSVVLLTSGKSEQLSWKVLKVRIHVRETHYGDYSSASSSPYPSVLSKEQELYLRNICQQIFDHMWSQGNQDTSVVLGNILKEMGNFLERKICLPMAMDLFKYQAFKLSKNPLLSIKIIPSGDTLSLKCWKDTKPNAADLKIRLIAASEEESQRLYENADGTAYLVINKWPFSLWFGLVAIVEESEAKSETSKTSVFGKLSTLPLKKLSGSILSISIQSLSLEAVIVQLMAFKCRYLLERLKKEIEGREEFQSYKVSLNDETISMGYKTQVQLCYLIIYFIETISVRIHISSTSGKIVCYTYQEYSGLEYSDPSSSREREFTLGNFAGVLAFLQEHRKCIIRTCIGCQTKSLSLPITSSNFLSGSRSQPIKFTVEAWDKYGFLCYTDLDTCILLSPLRWLRSKQEGIVSMDDYHFFCETLPRYNLFFVYHKRLDEEWLLKHGLDGCLGACWLTIIETRKRKRQLDSVLQYPIIEPLALEREHSTNVKTSSDGTLQQITSLIENNLFSAYSIEANSFCYFKLKPYKYSSPIPIQQARLYTNNFSVRRIWIDLQLPLLDNNIFFLLKRIVGHFFPWEANQRKRSYWSPDEQGIRLWYFGGQNTTKSLIFTYARGQLCLKKFPLDLWITRQVMRVIRMMTNSGKFFQLAWKSWRQLVFIQKPIETSGYAVDKRMEQPDASTVAYIRLDWKVLASSSYNKNTGAQDGKATNSQGESKNEGKIQQREAQLASCNVDPAVTTIKISPRRPFTKEVCYMLEEALTMNPSHIWYYLDALLDHIFLVLGCLELIPGRFQITWLTLFRIEIALPVGKERNVIIFNGVEFNFEESLEYIRLKNVGSFGINMNPTMSVKSTSLESNQQTLTTQKEKNIYESQSSKNNSASSAAASISGGGTGTQWARIPVNTGNSVFWSWIQRLLLENRDNIHVKMSGNDQVEMKSEHLFLFFQRLANLVEKMQASRRA